MSQSNQTQRMLSIGLDLGDRLSHLVAITLDGEILANERVATTRSALARRFDEFPRGSRVVCEAGTHSPWVSAVLEELGFEVIVANPVCAGRALAANGRKNDELDAVTLATLGWGSPRLLRPVRHRQLSAQNDLAVIRARDAVVRTRTTLINSVRGLVKSSGYRLKSCSSAAFHYKVREDIPEELEAAVLPMLEQIGQLSATVRSYDREIKALSEKYPETKSLQEINGVGPLTALAFVLSLENRERFSKSRKVGAYLGLVPKQHDSSSRTPQLRISKYGNSYLRRLLVGSAHYILGPFGEDCDLRRFGERLGQRGAARGKKQATVAVARKLAVLMHHLWASGERYDPLYSASRSKRRSA